MQRRQCLRAISDLRKAEREQQRLKTANHQEGLFFKNKWEFATNAVNGTLDKVAKTATFSKQKANLYYKSTYSKTTELIPENLEWFPPLPRSPASPDFMPFNMDPIRPKDVLEALKRSNKNSAPGPDDISYAVLMTAAHKPLATIYSKILKSEAATSCWSEAVIKLIHKTDDTNDPKNFRPLALGNCVGKIFDLILTRRF